MRIPPRVVLEGCLVVATAICLVLLRAALRRLVTPPGDPANTFPHHNEQARRPAFLPRTAD
jgi:hypothetical protein